MISSSQLFPTVVSKGFTFNQSSRPVSLASLVFLESVSNYSFPLQSPFHLLSPEPLQELVKWFLQPQIHATSSLSHPLLLEVLQNPNLSIPFPSLKIRVDFTVPTS